jgi:hypothetical protein
MMIITTSSKTSNKSGSKKTKSRTNFILSRVIAAVSANNSNNNRMKNNKGQQQHVFFASAIKVGRRDSDSTYHSLDGDTCHTADTSSSIDDALGLDFDNTSDTMTSMAPVLMRKLRSTKRSVSFAPMTAVRHTLSRRSYTAEELLQCWYQSEDYDRIHSACRRLLSKHEQCGGDHHRVKKYCMRGLENQTTLAFELRSRTRQEALRDVLGTQEEYPGDAEAIARRYASFSSSCQLWAHNVGLRDQKAAERYYDL